MIKVSKILNLHNLGPKFNKIANIRSYVNSLFTKNHEFGKKQASFTGAKVKPITSSEEIKELTDIFYDGLTHNLYPNKKYPHWKSVIDRFISMFPFRLAAKNSNSITEAATIDGKIVAGYSLSVNPGKNTYLNFLALSPEYMKTKEGIKILKMLGHRITENVKANNLEKLTFVTNKKNKQINRLLRRFNPVEVKTVLGGNTIYELSVEKLEEILGRIQ